ncbi:MAG: glycoside hydrolase family 140 protein [Tepidisphaeraceae bacterium]|jgi:hypothetical protein
MLCRAGIFAIALSGFFCAEVLADLPQLKVSSDGHYLMQADGKPFFWLGDTAWGLLDHPSRDDAFLYLKNREDKGFTVIQTVVLLWDSMSPRIPSEKQALVGGDPTKFNEQFFANADAIIDQAQADGMYVAIVPLWFKSYVTPTRMLLNPTTAENFGKYLGTRWRDKPIIWILGGDTPGGASRDPDHTPDQNVLAISRALAAGLKEGDGGNHLITYHPTGSIDGQSSSWWFENESWLDFNGLQTGHFIQNHNYKLVAADYALTPAKPVIDLESGYENITDHLRPASAPDVKRIQASDVRRYAYLATFAGAAGYTYGNAEIYGFVTATRPTGRFGSGLTWKQSLDLPAAGQMQYLRRLIESRPMLERIPDQSMIIGDARETTERIEAMRASDGSYAFAYSADGRPINLKLDALTGTKLTAWWYSPRDGVAQRIADFAKPDWREFDPPSDGDGHDWVLVLDDAAKNFAPPGAEKN